MPRGHLAGLVDILGVPVDLEDCPVARVDPEGSRVVLVDQAEIQEVLEEVVDQEADPLVPGQ